MTLTMQRLTAAILATLAYSAGAESQRQYDIPAQPLSTALQTFASQSGAPMLYTADSAAGKRSAGLNGTYSNSEALARLVADTGLIHTVAADGTVTLKPASDNKEGIDDASGTTLPKVTVEADTEYDPTWSTDPHNTDYTRTHASTATKTDTPIMETPYSVKVLPAQVLKDQQVIRLEDAIQSVAGVQSSFTNGGDSDVFIMRGFQNTNIYQDGFLMPSALGGGTLKRETANLERIEVLKGPGSVLFGRNEPGGVINMVTKRPLATPYYALQQQFGSYDFYRTTADATGPITKDDTLLYRVNLSYENSDSFRDFVKPDLEYISANPGKP
jgi:iron complex outermembrane recepter protein